MRILLSLLLLTSCTGHRITVRHDFYPKVTLDRTVIVNGQMVNRPQTFEATYEVTRTTE